MIIVTMNISVTIFYFVSLIKLFLYQPMSLTFFYLILLPIPLGEQVTEQLCGIYLLAESKLWQFFDQRSCNKIGFALSFSS